MPVICEGARMSRRKPFPIGERFGRLTVIAVARHDPRRGAYFMTCRCDCGETRDVREDCLTTGNTRSCGCLQPETAKANAKHGMWRSRTYHIWRGMKRRCAPGYKGKKAHLYAGKGIKVCRRWADSFEAFLEDMGEAPEGLTIEREDGNKGYEPGNCRWATPREQANNTSRNRLISYLGKAQTVAQWADETGIPRNTLLYRLRRGWTIERALTQPLQKRSARAPA